MTGMLPVFGAGSTSSWSPVAGGFTTPPQRERSTAASLPGSALFASFFFAGDCGGCGAWQGSLDCVSAKASVAGKTAAPKMRKAAVLDCQVTGLILCLIAVIG